MTESMKSFFEKLGKDEALQNKLKECKSPEEAFGVAKGAVDGLSFDDFTATMKKLNESLSQKQGELSDADLGQVAGGWSDAETAQIVSSTVTAAAPAAAAAV
ncbi:Nif11-like leader peptide family RiPP precursor [Desulfotomaculum sp. 1211_IL3151]|uniref:Nif11-like leader peptide family RiPP precursor n=1 Tax=Desulfotomaculum sp. 1211_IL3151 TaxID=3084055 RepID=UPI002FDA00C6